jgi:hypothetical protein
LTPYAARSPPRESGEETPQDADGLTPRLEGETHQEPDHDDYGHQTEEDDALPNLGTKIVRLFPNDSHIEFIPDRWPFHSCKAGRALVLERVLGREQQDDADGDLVSPLVERQLVRREALAHDALLGCVRSRSGGGSEEDAEQRPDQSAEDTGPDQDLHPRYIQPQNPGPRRVALLGVGVAKHDELPLRERESPDDRSEHDPADDGDDDDGDLPSHNMSIGNPPYRPQLTVGGRVTSKTPIEHDSSRRL